MRKWLPMLFWLLPLGLTGALIIAVRHSVPAMILSFLFCVFVLLANKWEAWRVRNTFASISHLLFLAAALIGNADYWLFSALVFPMTVLYALLIKFYFFPIVVGILNSAVFVTYMPEIATSEIIVHAAGMITVSVLLSTIVTMIRRLDALVQSQTAELQDKNAKLEQMVEELRSIDQIKNDFLASISHEIRTPLTAIKGSVELLETGLMGPLSDEQKELTGMAQLGIQRLLLQVNNLLDFSKLQTSNLILNKERTDYSRVIHSAAEIIKPLLEQKKQHLKLEIPQVPDIEVDSNRIVQVLLNLLTNAVKFTKVNGQISIKVENTERGIVTCIEDTGVGIPQEALQKVFERFYEGNQGKNDDKTAQFGIAKPHGTGLGLSIAKHIIETHEGSIWVDSEVGKGSRFYFLLPA